MAKTKTSTQKPIPTKTLKNLLKILEDLKGTITKTNPKGTKQKQTELVNYVTKLKERGMKITFNKETLNGKDKALLRSIVNTTHSKPTTPTKPKAKQHKKEHHVRRIQQPGRMRSAA